MPATKKPIVPLYCRRCTMQGRYGVPVTAAGAQQRRRIGGKQRVVNHVRCANGHEWWSRHPEARQLGRAADRAAAGR